MAEARSDQEPSIEEILASIREIISDDEAPAKAAVPSPEPAPAPEPVAEPVAEPKEDDDVLDLGAFADPAAKNDPLAGIDFDKPKVMTVEFTEPEAVPEPEPMPEPEPEPVFEPEPITSSLSAVAPAAAVIEKPVVEPVMDDTDSLLTDNAKAASMDSLTRLAQNIAISRAGQGGTLEDIVRELVKPMLRDWLDRNLPPMIERMVERELERLVKQAMDR